MIFYVDKMTNPKYPCVFLESNNWDDYSFKTTFYVSLYEAEGRIINIGQTKIVKRDLSVEDGKHDAWTLDFLPEYFENLSYEFVSLGQDESYYKNLKKLDSKFLNEILVGLRDCGYERGYLDGFKSRSIKDSLFRSITAEKMLNEARFILFAENLEDAFHINFEFIPRYNSDQKTNIELNFDTKNKYFPNRIIGVVGENGAGKTQIIDQLPLYIQKNNSMFNKIIHITNSYYDKGVDFDTDLRPEYHYFGLVTKKDGKEIILSKENQIEELKNVINIIVDRYKKEIDSDLIKRSFMDISTLFYRVNFEKIIEEFDKEDSKSENLDLNEFLSDFKLLSSGESILLSNLIKILGCISFNSIFLIDEPEIHLHPNFITSYMEFIYKILNRFDSYAFIATHSSFVVREIKADCVFVIRRTKNNDCDITTVTRQTFGTNAMSLAINIFENDEIQPYFITQIKRAAYEGLSEEDIFKIFEFDENHKLDLGIKMKIHSLFEKL